MRRQFVNLGLLAAVLILTGLIAQPAPVSAQSTTLIPVYRFYFHGTGGWYEGADAHLFSRSTVPPGEGWLNEGLVFHVSPSPQPYMVPLYVVYNLYLVDHFYTTDVSTRDYLLTTPIDGVFYQDQGILGYVLPTDQDYPGSTPLYRWVRAYEGIRHYQDHFYQTSASPVGDYGSEGIACRVWTQPLQLPVKLVEYVSPAAGPALHVNDTATITWKVWSNSGVVRLSYSTDNGASWRPITTVQNGGMYGAVTVQSYKNWKIPPEAVGKIRIKVDWMKGYAEQQKPSVPAPAPPAGQLPWATDIGGPLTVLDPSFRLRVPALRKP